MAEAHEMSEEECRQAGKFTRIGHQIDYNIIFK
jgi:hypothetical protein